MRFVRCNEPISTTPPPHNSSWCPLLPAGSPKVICTPRGWSPIFDDCTLGKGEQSRCSRGGVCHLVMVHVPLGLCAHVCRQPNTLPPMPDVCSVHRPATHQADTREVAIWLRKHDGRQLLLCKGEAGHGEGKLSAAGLVGQPGNMIKNDSLAGHSPATAALCILLA